MQMLQQPDKITIVYDEDHEVRHVRLNQPHPAQVTPSWYGDSVGHYEGDTLVIDTVGIKIGAAVRHGRYVRHALHAGSARGGTLSAAGLRSCERGAGTGRKGALARPRTRRGWAPDPNYRGKELQLHFTVEDDGVFTMPWSATVTYRRPLATEWPENVCAENTEWHPGTDSAVPIADKPDF